MHAITVLQEDHERILALFEELDAVGPEASGEKVRLLEQFGNHLLVHVIAEDNIFLPQVEDAVEESKQTTSEFFEQSASVLVEVSELTAASYQSHRQLTALLEEMERLEPDSGRWEEKYRELRDVVVQQIEDEERLFPKAKLVLEDEDFERIGDLIEHCKGQVRGFAQAKLASSASQSSRTRKVDANTR